MGNGVRFNDVIMPHILRSPQDAFLTFQDHTSSSKLRVKLAECVWLVTSHFPLLSSILLSFRTFPFTFRPLISEISRQLSHFLVIVFLLPFKFSLNLSVSASSFPSFTLTRYRSHFFRLNLHRSRFLSLRPPIIPISFLVKRPEITSTVDPDYCTITKSNIIYIQGILAKA